MVEIVVICYLIIIISSLKGHSWLKYIRCFARFWYHLYNFKNVKNATGGNVTLTEAATRGVLCEKVFLEIWQISQENTCARVSFLIKKRPATLLKRRLWHRCFPVNFVKFLRTPFLQNTSGRLLLLWIKLQTYITESDTAVDGCFEFFN